MDGAKVTLVHILAIEFFVARITLECFLWANPRAISIYGDKSRGKANMQGRYLECWSWWRWRWAMRDNFAPQT